MNTEVTLNSESEKSKETEKEREEIGEEIKENKTQTDKSIEELKKEIKEKADKLVAMETDNNYLKGFIKQIEEEKDDNAYEYETTVGKWVNVAEKLMEHSQCQSKQLEKQNTELINIDRDNSITKAKQMQSREVKTEVSDLSIKSDDGHTIVVNDQTITFTVNRVDLDDEELESIKSHAAESDMSIKDFSNNGVAEMAKVAESFIQTQ